MRISDIMMVHWRVIAAVLRKYGASEADTETALNSYKDICWRWCNDAAKAGGHGPDWQRENWPDEWSVCRNSDYCEL